METLHFENIHHTHYQDEEEDTLSLCDLPLYSDEDLSSQESTSFSSSGDDFFEFFSQEYFNPSPPAGAPPENIIFCGKLIPYKQPYCCDAKSPFEISRKQDAHITKKKQDYGVISRWDIGSSNSTSERYCIDSKNDKTRATPLTPVHKTVKNRHIVSSPLRCSQKKVKGCDFPVQKFPVMASSPSGKAKWYLFFFGISKLSSAKELGAMNSRRSRPPPPPPALRVRSGNKNICIDNKDIGWRMGGLIGALSCGGHLKADTMVAASIGRPTLK